MSPEEVERLVPNEANPRRHPQRQAAAVLASIRENGWAACLLANTATDPPRLVDGHLRRDLVLQAARKAGLDKVPVLLGAFSPEAEKRLLLQFDATSAMSEFDSEALARLAAEVQADLDRATAAVERENAEAIGKLASELDAYGSNILSGGPASFMPDSAEWMPAEKPAREPRADRPPSVYGLKPREAIGLGDWGQRDIYDIPKLLPSQCAECPSELRCWIGPESEPSPAYLLIWGSYPIHAVQGECIVGYFSSDDRFQDTWNRPEHAVELMLAAGVKRSLSVDFSVYAGDDLATDLWAVYRSRWFARYAAEAGVLCIPSLQLGGLEDRPEQRWPIRLAGLPVGLPAVAAQLQTSAGTDERLYRNSRLQRLRKAIGELRPQALLLYCREELSEWMKARLPGELHVICVPPLMLQRGRIIRGKHPTTS